MNKLIIVFMLGFFSALQMQAQGFPDIVKKAKGAIPILLSEDEVGSALKEALQKGAGDAAASLAAQDGYYKSAYKILLPEEAQQIVSKLKVVPGFENVEEQLIEKMNRAAEDAASKAGPIFVDAIRKMTIQDAMNLLMGEKDAATRYLERTTYDPLYQAFRPVIIEALDKVNARAYWRSAVTAYNKIPLVKKTNPELDDHVAKTGLTGLFALIELKEADIRANPAARSSELLKKVFARQDKK
jgi:hypothetical protein